MSAHSSSPSPWWMRGPAAVWLQLKEVRFNFTLSGGKLARAEECAREDLSFAETTFPLHHRRVIKCRQNLVEVLTEQGNCAEAARQTKLIAEALDALSGPSSTPAMRAWLSYANLRYQTGELAAAEETYLRIVDTAAQGGRRDCLESLTARYCLANFVWRVKEEYDRVYETLRDVCRGYRERLGAVHYRTLHARMHLARLEACHARRGEALDELRGLIPIFRNQFGMKDGRFILARFSLGATLYSMGRSIEAEAELRDLHGYTFTESHSSPLSHSTAGEILCHALLDQGRHEDARAFAEVELHRLGPDNPERYDLFGGLARALRLSGEASAAEKILREALKTVSDAHGAESRSTLGWRKVLSDHFINLKSPGAIELCRINVAIEEKYFGPDSCNALSSRNSLVYSLMGAGLHGEAVNEARAVCEAYLRGGHGSDPMAIAARETLALALTRAGCPAEAEPTFRQIVAGFEASACAEHRWCLETRLHFAEALRDLGKTTEATNHAQQALDTLLKLRGGLAPDVLRAQAILQSLNPSP